LNEVKAFFNQTITFNIVEDVPDGEKSQYDSYALRFAPLSENAVKESWSGTLKGANGASTKFTLLGFLQAGCPKELQLFKPGDDPDSDEPELTLGFKLSAPITEVTLGGLPLEELLGTYFLTFNSNVSEESDSGHFTFMRHEEQLGFRSDDSYMGSFLLPGGPYEYNPATATATCEFKSEELSLSVKVNFVSEDGIIHLSSAATIYEGENTVTVYGEGTKID
jgi:hypothetical protein